MITTFLRPQRTFGALVATGLAIVATACSGGAAHDSSSSSTAGALTNTGSAATPTASSSTGLSPTDSTGSGGVRAVYPVRRTFTAAYRLEGSIETSPAVVLIDRPALAFKSDLGDGSVVTPGQPIGEMVVNPSFAADMKSSGSAIDADRLVQVQQLTSRVTAPSKGTLRFSSPAPTDPKVATVAVIEAPGTDLVARLTPVQLLRYQAIGFTATATVETVVGNRTVPCDALWIQSGASNTPSNADGSETTTSEQQSAGDLHCRLPQTTETAPGLAGVLSLSSKPVPDALLVPNVFIGYNSSGDQYEVRVRRTDGTIKSVPVTVGVTDGVVRVVTSDLPTDLPLVAPDED